MATAKKSPAKKAATRKAPAGTKTASGSNKIARSATKKAPAKTIGAHKSVNKPSSANTCWPGFEPTPGKSKGEKGSCKPKKNATKAEKKADQKAAAASKLSR